MAGIHRTAHPVLPRFDIGRVEQEVGGGRGAEVKVEGSVGSNSDARRDGDTGVNVSGTGIEFLDSMSIKDCELGRR